MTEHPDLAAGVGAALLTATDGDPRSIRLTQRAMSLARAGHVTVRVEASGVSFAEVQLLRGLHPRPPRPPFVPGYDLVGEIVEVGPSVSGWARGDRVAAMPRHGGWQECVEVPASILAPVPRALDAAEAVALVLNGVTAWQLVHRRLRTTNGQTVLVQGATGGVGSLATQLAVRLGARVIGTASPARHAEVRALGAEPVDYAGDLAAAVRALAPDGVDAVLDHIGGPGLDVLWALLAPGGTLVTYDSSVEGHVSGQWLRPHLPSLRRMALRTGMRAVGATRGRRIRGYYVRPGDRFRADLASLYALLADGAIRPVVAGRFPLDQAPDAVARLMAGGVVGKMVIVP